MARYTTTPGVIGLAQAKAVDRLEDAGLTADIGTPAYSETVPAGEVVATEPDPGSRVLGEGTVTLTVSLGKERYDVPELAGKTEDQAQDALAEAHLASASPSSGGTRSVPAGTVIRTDPEAGKTLKPNAAVDLVVSKGKQPIKLKDWTGKSADDAERGHDREGPGGRAASARSTPTTSRRATCSPRPRRPAPSSGARRSSWWSPRAPSWSPCPTGWCAMGVDAATEAAEPPSASRSRSSRARPTSASATSWRSTRLGGTMLPKGSTVTLYLV